MLPALASSLGALLLLLPLSPVARAQSAPATAYVYVPFDGDGLLGSGGRGISGDLAVGHAVGLPTDLPGYAAVWNAVTGERRTLDQTGLTDSFGYAISGDRAVGTGVGAGVGTNSNAFVWDVHTGQRTTLNATDLTQSFGYAISGDRAVGYGYGLATNGEHTAFVWDLTTGSRETLGRAGFNETYAMAVDGNVVVGYGRGPATTGSQFHALSWGTIGGGPMVLDNAGLSQSTAHGVSGNLVVGEGRGAATGNATRAFAWGAQTGDRTTLDSAGLTISSARAISGSLAVGYGTGAATGGQNQAFVWDATTGARTSLAPFLLDEPLAVGPARAFGIGADGSITGRAGDHGFVLRPFQAAGGSAVATGQTARSNGDFEQTDGATTINGTFRFVGDGADTYTLAGGTLGGAGTLAGDLINAGGTVAPGNSPGTLFVSGSFTQLAGGTLAVELAGAGPGQFDALVVGGTAGLGGTLAVALTGAFVPADGQTFDILTAAGGITGAFSAVTSGFSVSVVNGGTTLRLTAGGSVAAAAVPEPGTLALAAPALLAPFGLRAAVRRRHRQ